MNVSLAVAATIAVCGLMASARQNAHGQESEQTATPSPVAQHTPTVVVGSPPTTFPTEAFGSDTELTPDPFVWPTVAPSTLSSDRSVTSVLVEDADRSGTRTPADLPANTLVELIGPGRVVGLLTDEAGRFRFDGLEQGEYLLAIWWPGFIDVPTSETNSSLFLSTIRVDEDGTTTGYLPPEILVTARESDSILTYPVRTGSTAPIPGGFVDLGGGSSPVGLPSTGGPGSGAQGWQLVVLAVASLAGAAVVGIALRGRMGQPR